MTLQDFLAEDSLDVTDDDIGEFLINVITRGLYIEPHIILREYIQNSHDAIVNWESMMEVGRIDIKLEPPNIHIIDNGPGMSGEELRAAMRKIGISTKSIGSSSGFMGIGKLAGLSMAEQVYITSSKYGLPEKNRVVFYANEMQQAIEERRRRGDSKPIADTLKEHSHINLNPMPEEIDAHYTSIHLLRIDDEYWKMINNRDEFIKKLGLVAPVKQDPKFLHAPAIENFLGKIAPEHYNPLEVYIDSIPLYRSWYSNLQQPREIEALNDQGDRIAYGWVCQHNESEQIPDPLLRGIALMQRGIAIGERSLAEDLGLYGSNPIYFKWHMGEIYVTDPNILLTANRMSMRRDQQATDFLLKVMKELKKVSRAAAEFSQKDNARKKAPEHIKTIQQVAEKVNTRSLDEELVPSTVKQLAIASQDLKKRSKHLSADVQVDANDAVQIADRLITQLTIRGPVPQLPLNPNEYSADVLVMGNNPSEYTTISEEENKEIFSIADKLKFSQKEKLIFQTIVEAIANVSGGKDSKDFVKYIQEIQKALYTKFQ